MQLLVDAGGVFGDLAIDVGIAEIDGPAGHEFALNIEFGTFRARLADDYFVNIIVRNTDGNIGLDEVEIVRR